MKVLILAAGRGSRLGELTKDRPKPIIEIGGRTVLERIIDNLHSHGIYEIIINCHYLPLIITERVSTNALYFYEEHLLGHDGTISALRKWLENDDFIVQNGDTISNVNYTDMLLNHKIDSISVLLDNWRAAGTWIYSKDYFTKKNLPIIPYRPANLIWHDIGDPSRLQIARDFYEEGKQ